MHYGLTSSTSRHGARTAAQAGRRDHRLRAPAPTAMPWSSELASSPDPLRRANARGSRGADDIRPEACATCVRGGQEPGCLDDAFEQVAVGKLSGAVGTYASVSPLIEPRVMEALGLTAEDVSTQVIPRDRHAVLLARDRDRRRRPRALRRGDPQPAAHRGPRGRGAVRKGQKGSSRDASQAQPDHRRAPLRARARPARLRAGRIREHRALARARHLALGRRAHRPAGRHHRPRLHAAPRDPICRRHERCTPTGCARTSSSPTARSSASARSPPWSNRDDPRRCLPACPGDRRSGPGTRRPASAS